MRKGTGAQKAIACLFLAPFYELIRAAVSLGRDSRSSDHTEAPVTSHAPWNLAAASFFLLWSPWPCPQLLPYSQLRASGAWCKLSLPAGSGLARVARGRRYLRCGAWPGLPLSSPKPLQRPARISPGTFLSHRFLNHLVKGTSCAWGVSEVLMSCFPALGLPPSIKRSLRITTGPNCPNGFNS